MARRIICFAPFIAFGRRKKAKPDFIGPDQFPKKQDAARAIADLTDAEDALSTMAVRGFCKTGDNGTEGPLLFGELVMMAKKNARARAALAIVKARGFI